MGKLWNRISNTIGIAPRTVKTAARTTMDTTKSALNLVLDPFIGLWKTWLSIKDAIHKSFTEGPRYRKLWKAPASLALSPFMAVEWVAETLRWTWVNACSSVRDIIWNTLTNEWTAIKMMWKWEKFKFTTDKLEYKRLSPRNRLASLFWTKAEEQAQIDYIKTREKTLKSQEDNLNKERENRKIEKEKWLNNTKTEQDKLKAERENRRNERKAEQEKIFQSIKQERETFSKQKEEFNKRISLLEQEKKNLEEALKSAKTEASENMDKKTNIVKFTPKVEKKETNDGSKPAEIIKMNSKTDTKWTTGANEKAELKQAA